MSRLRALADRLTARSLACRLRRHERCTERVFRAPLFDDCWCSCSCARHNELLAAKEAVSS